MSKVLVVYGTGSGCTAGVAERIGKTLREKPVAFYTACLTLAQEPGKTDEVRAYTDPLIAETGVKPVDIGMFAGWNEPKRFSFIERTIMKMMKAPQGDFRDWAKIGAWVEETAPKLGLAG